MVDASPFEEVNFLVVHRAAVRTIYCYISKFVHFYALTD